MTEPAMTQTGDRRTPLAIPPAANRAKNNTNPSELSPEDRSFPSPKPRTNFAALVPITISVLLHKLFQATAQFLHGEPFPPGAGYKFRHELIELALAVRIGAL